MKAQPFKISEEIIYKKGTRRCSGRIRDGKLLYYIPTQLKQDTVKKVVLEIRESLLQRLTEAYQYHDYFTKNFSTVTDHQQLAKMAQMIYLRKYPKLDFLLTIKFRRQKTVMGTYRRSRTGEVTIYVNDYFKNAPLFLIELVIAHELSHHHYSGHDRAFYGELAQLCADYQTKGKLASQYLILKEAQLL